MIWLLPSPPKEIYDYWKELYLGIGTVQENLEWIQSCGYNILGHITLPEDIWWVEYYHPLEKCIKELRQKYVGDSKTLTILDEEQKEIDMFKRYKKWYGSAFFIMQKR